MERGATATPAVKVAAAAAPAEQCAQLPKLFLSQVSLSQTRKQPYFENLAFCLAGLSGYYVNLNLEPETLEMY